MSLPQNTGSFVPVSNIWDVSQVSDLNIDPALKELLIQLYQNLNLMAINLNLKDTGYYSQLEFVNGHLWFPNPSATPSTSKPPTYRQVFRKVINFGALPNTALKQVAHGITVTAATTFTRIYGCASDTTNKVYLPLPYASPTDANEIELSVDATYVNITTGSNRTSFNITYVILEWLKF